MAASADVRTAADTTSESFGRVQALDGQIVALRQTYDSTSERKALGEAGLRAAAANLKALTQQRTLAIRAYNKDLNLVGHVALADIASNTLADEKTSTVELQKLNSDSMLAQIAATSAANVANSAAGQGLFSQSSGPSATGYVSNAFGDGSTATPADTSTLQKLANEPKAGLGILLAMLGLGAYFILKG